MKTYFLQAFKGYRELITKGKISSMAIGDHVCIEFHGHICGDILIFISPKTMADEEYNILELLRLDTQIIKQTQVAYTNFRLKINGLTFLPTGLAWITNIGISFLFVRHYFEIIYTELAGHNLINGIWQSLPVLIPATATVLFGKRMGALVMKPLFKIITYIIKLVRKLRNRRVYENNR